MSTDFVRNFYVSDNSSAMIAIYSNDFVRIVCYPAYYMFVHALNCSIAIEEHCGNVWLGVVYFDISNIFFVLYNDSQACASPLKLLVCIDSYSVKSPLGLRKYLGSGSFVVCFAVRSSCDYRSDFRLLVDQNR
jgi:hypothetical protein